ncbi:MAG: response regulator transcription factor [Rhodospirillales bacterium]|nr:response regulator transcription factor [Rhodospirillales bacterium]MBT5519816.1 response regulator transcription factor [Rhodospirillales bacterium]MBT7146772.1 response regulator transcription factor [Rhodospirillales bacterium]
MADSTPTLTSTDAPHILVVDDDDRIRDLLRQYLTEHGFVVTIASDAADARTRIGLLQFDLLVLDLMMPGESGLEFAASIRETNTVPILMLTAMAEPGDRIAGLEQGADDYLTKPFEPRELLLRIQSILRRVPGPSVPDEVSLGDSMFVPARGELLRAGVPIRLTDVEVALLSALAERSGEILSRDELIAVTGADASDRAIDVQVTRLRRKIERDPKVPRYLQTVRGRGYVLKPD